MVDLLVDLGRLESYQRADPLAVGKALVKLLNDWIASGLTLQEYVDTLRTVG